MVGELEGSFSAAFGLCEKSSFLASFFGSAAEKSQRAGDGSNQTIEQVDRDVEAQFDQEVQAVSARSADRGRRE